MRERLNELYTQLKECNRKMRYAQSRNEYDDAKFERNCIIEEIENIENRL